MAPALNDLLNDGRLARLFSKDACHCALQLWVLQIISGGEAENRIVYGRLLPFRYSDDSWSFSDNDGSSTFGHVKAAVTRLNLYVKSSHCADLLQKLSAGQTISAISEELKFEIPDKLERRFGTSALATDGLVYRPVAYLLNRDAYERGSLSSPHGDAGAFSASITQVDKRALFRLGQDYDVALTSFVVKRLNADTGLDFGGTDTPRFGDLELLVFPALDDQERPLLNVSWTDSPHTLVARFNPVQIPHFGGFQMRLHIENGGQIVYSGVATAERDEEGVFECRFDVEDELRARTDSSELEIFGFHDDHARKGTLCCRWRVGYIREIHFQGHAVGRSASPVKFDWLENATRPSVSARVKAALTINRGDLGFANHVGGRESDPWVPANRDLVSLFAQIHPLKSEGRFFLRWGEGDGEGRLQFVEWFKGLMTKYQQHQVVIFDPYFEDAGLGLLLLSVLPGADYIVFRSLPKPKESRAEEGKSSKSAQERINNLVVGCEHNRHLLGRIKLRIYGIKEGRLHDRYILIMGSDGLPIAGFNLSNSFQVAAQTQPLLITPIPSDVLLKVEQYKSELVREAQAVQSGGETENPSIRLLFDSAASPIAPQRYEPLRFLEKTNAGDVLSAWVNEPVLQGLCGESLTERMAALGLLKNNSLTLPETDGLRICLDQQTSHFSDFALTWEILGEILAHSHARNSHHRSLESNQDFLEFLVQFLEASFNRVHAEERKELAVIDPRRFRDPIETLLYSSSQPHQFFHPTKYVALTWAEYYAIRFLWWYASDSLLALFEKRVADVPIEPQVSDAIQLSLLSQIVSEISLSVQFDISEEQRNRLVRSDNGLLQWMGLNAIEMQLEKPEGLADALELVAAFSYFEQVRVLGWMVRRAEGKLKKIEIYNGLVAALHDALPMTISAGELKSLIDSMRGHMRRLTWAEPWLFRDVIFPLLQNDRASIDDACEIWVQELAALLEPELEGWPQSFDQAREGQTTNITAFLFAYSSPERQQASLKGMRKILKKRQQIVRQPLASTSDWTKWDGALVVSMWLLVFTRWGKYYLRQRGMTDSELDELSQDAHELVMLRSMGEWRSMSMGKRSELVAFFDQAEGLLALSDEPQNSSQ